MKEFVFVYITTPDRASARELAEILVRERLAAGANILNGVESLYWWQEELRKAGESVCILKTTASGYPALEQRAREIHPYEVPCIVALPVLYGHAPFLLWIDAETRPEKRV